MDKVLSIINELNLEPPRKKSAEGTENILAKLVPFEEWCKKQEGETYTIFYARIYRDEILIKLLDKPELLDTLLFLCLTDKHEEEFCLINETSNKFMVNNCREMRDKYLMPVMNKYYPPKVSSIEDKSLKNKTSDNIVEYNMLIKNAHFEIVYKSMYRNVDSSLLGSNPYKHKADLKKKFLKGEVEKEVNGKKMLDHQLVMFNRLFQLEMMALDIK